MFSLLSFKDFTELVYSLDDINAIRELTLQVSKRSSIRFNQHTNQSFHLHEIIGLEALTQPLQRRIVFVSFDEQNLDQGHLVASSGLDLAQVVLHISRQVLVVRSLEVFVHITNDSVPRAVPLGDHDLVWLLLCVVLGMARLDGLGVDLLQHSL